MIVDDSPFLEKMMIESLTKAGFVNILAYTNGSEAWEKLQQYKNTGLPIADQVSIILTDIEMPQMDGHRLLKLVRDDPDLRIVPVVIFSSLITEEMRKKGEALGATAQLAKPDIAELVLTIDKYML
jgi:two-component system chemotaxis response regulator CheV